MLKNRIDSEDKETSFKNSRYSQVDSITKWIFIFVMFMGLMIMIFSVIEFIDANNKTKDYVNCEGTVVYISDSSESKTIRVTYQVEDVIYQTTASENITSNVEKGDMRYVKYNPDNYEDAVIRTFDSNILVFVIGFTFAMISLILVLAKKGSKDKTINSLISALIIIDASILIIALSYALSTVNPIKIIRVYPISIVMYLGFIAGIVFYLLRKKSSQNYTLELVEKKEIEGKYLYIFEYEKAKVNWLRFYSYMSSEEIDIFEEIEKFKVKIGDNCMISKNESLKDTPYSTLIDISTVRIEDFIPKK